MTTQGIYLDAREVTDLEELRDQCGEVVTTAAEWRACFLLAPSRAEQIETAQGVIDTYWRMVELEQDCNRLRAELARRRGAA